MRAKGEAKINKVEYSIAKIHSFISISYIEDDYSELVKAIGGEIEKFLKSDVLGGLGLNKNFHELVEQLKNLGVSQIYIDSLHEFIRCYNGYKRLGGGIGRTAIEVICNCCTMVFKASRNRIKGLKGV